MNAQQLMAKKEKEKEAILKWVRSTGLKNTMTRTAKHLLPGKTFTFVLNAGGGSYTDGKKVVVGIPELVYGMDKETIYAVTKALTGHETEHVWSSDFDVFKSFQQEVKDYFRKNHNLRITPKLGAHMLNSTEDGRIEKRLVNRYRGYKKHIQLLNGIFWTHQPCDGKNEMMNFLYSFTSMCVTGLKSKEWELHYEGTEADELLDQARPLMMKAINNPTARGCADDTMEIIEIIAPYMARMLEDLKNRQEMEEKLSDKPDYESNTPQEGEGSQPGNSQSSHFLEPEEEEEKESGDSDEEGEGEGKESDKESDDDSKSKSKSKSKSEDEEGDQDEESDEDGSGDNKDKENEDGEDSDSDSEGEEGDEKSEESDDSEDSMKPSDEDQQSPEPSDEVNEDEKPKPSPEEIEKMIEEMIESLQDEVADEADKAMEQGQKEVERETAREEKENKFTGHLVEKDMKGLDKGVIFHQLDPTKHRTHEMPSEVLKRGRLINKELTKVFLNKQTFTSRNRRNGQLDTNSLWKKGVKDYNMFVKKGVPNDSSFAINVLVDASGSMKERVDNTGATKLSKATEATAMIEEALRDLVPVRITYFTAAWDQVMHSTVKDFNQSSKDTLSWKRLPAFQSLANRDGYSIKVGTRELLKRSEQKKILIILSDGLPTEPNDSMGQKEVHEAVREARQAGVIVIAIAFGSEQEMARNKNVYKEMYQNGIIMARPDEIHKYLSKTIQTEINR